MKNKIWKILLPLPLALAIVLVAGVLNADSWLHASNGEETAQEETAATAPKAEQGTTSTETLELPSQSVEEVTEETTEATEEAAEETTEATGEATEPVEETTEPTEEPAEETTEPTEEVTEPAQEPVEEPTEPAPEEEESAFTVTAVGYTGVYDAKVHKASYTVSDPIGTTISYSLDGGETWTTTAPSIKDVDVITFLVKAENPNYKTAISSGTLEVTPATITISTASAQKTYNGKALTASGIKVTGLVGGEYLKCYATGYRTDVGQSKNVYMINWFDSTAKYKNYIVVNDYGILEVTPAVLTVTTYSGNKVYDGTPLTAGGMINGLIWGETATFTVTGSQTEEGVSENTYSLVFDGTAEEGNYIIVEKLGTLTVTAPRQ